MKKQLDEQGAKLTTQEAEIKALKEALARLEAKIGKWGTGTVLNGCVQQKLMPYIVVAGKKSLHIVYFESSWHESIR